MNKTRRLNLTIVIIANKNHKYLRELIAEIRNYIFNIEMIVVENHNRTTFLNPSGDLDDFKVIKLEKSSASNARNYGASRATRDFLLFVDGDIKSVSQVLKKIHIDLKTVKDSFLFYYLDAYKKNEKKFNLKYVIKKTLFLSEAQRLPRAMKRPIFPDSACFLCSKELYYRMDGFSLDYARCEDAEFFYRAFLLNISCNYPGHNATVTKYIDETFVEFLKSSVEDVWYEAKASVEHGLRYLSIYLRLKYLKSIFKLAPKVISPSYLLIYLIFDITSLFITLLLIPIHYIITCVNNK